MLRMCSVLGSCLAYHQSSLLSLCVMRSGESTGGRDGIYFRHCQEGFHPVAAAAVGVVDAPGDAPCLGPFGGKVNMLMVRRQQQQHTLVCIAKKRDAKIVGQRTLKQQSSEQAFHNLPSQQCIGYYGVSSLQAPPLPPPPSPRLGFPLTMIESSVLVPPCGKKLLFVPSAIQISVC